MTGALTRNPNQKIPRPVCKRLMGEDRSVISLVEGLTQIVET